MVASYCFPPWLEKLSFYIPKERLKDWKKHPACMISDFSGIPCTLHIWNAIFSTPFGWKNVQGFLGSALKVFPSAQNKHIIGKWAMALVRSHWLVPVLLYKCYSLLPARVIWNDPLSHHRTSSAVSEVFTYLRPLRPVPVRSWICGAPVDTLWNTVVFTGLTVQPLQIPLQIDLPVSTFANINIPVQTAGGNCTNPHLRQTCKLQHSLWLRQVKSSKQNFWQGNKLYIRQNPLSV